MLTVSYVYEADDIAVPFGPFLDRESAASWALQACQSYCSWMNSTGEDYSVASTLADVLEEGIVYIYDGNRFHELDEVYFRVDPAPTPPELFDPSKLLSD